MAHSNEEEMRESQEKPAAAQGISEGVAAARAEMQRRAEMKSGVKKPEMKTGTGIPGGQTLKSFVLKAVISLVVLVCIGYFLVASLAGTLNLAVNSNNPDLKGRAVTVSIYNGDVSSLLSDGDPSNDPEPAETHNCTIGQRTTFNLHDFGSHTLWAQLSDGNTEDGTCQPYVVTAWGLDIGTQIWFD